MKKLFVEVYDEDGFLQGYGHLYSSSTDTHVSITTLRVWENSDAPDTEPQKGVEELRFPIRSLPMEHTGG